MEIATSRRESVEALKKIAVDAHYWNSFNPERAAETVLDCIESELCQYQSQIPEELHKDFESRYLDLTRQWLYALSRCASAAVTGPAKFNVRKAEKANNAEHAARGRIYDFAARFIKRANRQQRLTGWEEIERLQIKVDQLTQLQELMKATNVIIRNKKLSDEEKIDEIVMLGISESNAKKLLEPDFCGRIGFASYQLTNNLAKIKQAQGRIDNLTKMVNTENREVEFDWGTIELDYQDERIRLHFNDIPPVELRTKLKENAFKWSRMNQAWQRQLTENALRATKRIFELDSL
jgi:hypothetical protein